MSKKYIIKEKELKNIISQSIKTIIKESDGNSINMLKHGEFSNHGSIINCGNLIELNTKELFLKYAKQMWNILQKSYSNIGGNISYNSFKDFLKKGHLAHVIIDNNDNVIACETYRNVGDSLKLVCGGCLQTNEGKLGLQQLIQNDIVNFNLHYWAEVSGAIEHYFKKYNGFPMPSSLASDILEISPELIEEMEDKVHYKRKIGVNGDVYEKMIYGIKSEDIFAQVIKEIEDYGSFMKKINLLNESEVQLTLKQIIFIVENIYRAHEEDGFNELIPSWYEALNICLRTLNKMEKTNTVITYIRYCRYLLEEMPLLTINSL